MSAILLPFIAAGGIYLAIDAFSNKTRKHHRSHLTKSTRSHRKKHSDTDSYSTSTESSNKSKITSTDSYTKSAPLKSRRKRHLSKGRDVKHLFSLRIDHQRQNKKKSLEKESRNLCLCSYAK